MSQKKKIYKYIYNLAVYTHFEIFYLFFQRIIFATDKIDMWDQIKEKIVTILMVRTTENIFSSRQINGIP